MKDGDKEKREGRGRKRAGREERDQEGRRERDGYGDFLCNKSQLMCLIIVGARIICNTCELLIKDTFEDNHTIRTPAQNKY